MNIMLSTRVKHEAKIVFKYLILENRTGQKQRDFILLDISFQENFFRKI